MTLSYLTGSDAGGSTGDGRALVLEDWRRLG